MVLRYEGYEEQAAGPATFRELPCTFVPVIIDLDAGWSVAHRQHTTPLRLGSFVAGVTDGPVLVGHGGSARCLQVDLTPLGARQLVGLPMSELANQSVPIDAVLGRFGRDLVQRVGDAPDWPTRFTLIEQGFPGPPRRGRARRSWRRVVAEPDRDHRRYRGDRRSRR